MKGSAEVKIALREVPSSLLAIAARFLWDFLI